MTAKRKNEDSDSEEGEYRSDESVPKKRTKKDTSEKKSKVSAKNSASSKSQKSSSDKDGQGDKFRIDLGKKKHVTVDEFKGQPLINIREYYVANGEEKPGKKGIALTIEQWQTLRENIEAIDEHIRKFSKS